MNPAVFNPPEVLGNLDQQRLARLAARLEQTRQRRDELETALLAGDAALEAELERVEKLEQKFRAEYLALHTRLAAPPAAAETVPAAQHPPPQTQAAIQIDLTRPAWPGCLILHVQSCRDEEGHEAFRLLLADGDADPLRTEPQRRPDFDLESVFQQLLQANDAAARPPAKNTWGKIAKYARSPKLMVLWRELQILYKQQIRYLLVCDHTPYAIPWEMLRFDEERYLGAEFNVVRQADVSAFHETPPDPRPLRRNGHVLAYLLDSLAAQENDFFQHRLHAQISLQIQALHTWLTQPADGCALFYLSCHGLYANGDMHLGCDQNPSERLSYAELETFALPRIAGSVVFLNACHSARQQQACHDHYLRSFPELFLSKGAHGVISTLVSVNNHYAAQVAEALLQKTLHADAAPLPALLRELRQQAQSRLKLGAADADYLWALNVFCYVYHGHPRLHLQLGDTS